MLVYEDIYEIAYRRARKLLFALFPRKLCRASFFLFVFLFFFPRFPTRVKPFRTCMHEYMYVFRKLRG